MKYSAPPGTLVYWIEATARRLKSPTVINLDEPYNPNDHDSFYRRYAEGDLSPARVGSGIMSFDFKRFGGPARDEVKAWKLERGDTSEPDLQEIADWSLRYGDNAAPLPKPTGEKHNPIPVEDRSFPPGLRLVGNLWYFNDLSSNSEGRGRLMPTEATPPTQSQPSPPAQQGDVIGPLLRIDFDFRKAKTLPLPPGARKVRFEGTLVVPALTGDAVRPILAVKVGDVDGQREVGALFNVGGREQWRVEAGGRRAKVFQKGFGAVKPGSHDVVFEWTPGTAYISADGVERSYSTGVTEDALKGGLVVLGVDLGSEYQQLPPGALLSGVLKIEGGAAQPGPIVPPPPSSGVALAEALAHLDAASTILRRLT